MARFFFEIILFARRLCSALLLLYLYKRIFSAREKLTGPHSYRELCMGPIAVDGICTGTALLAGLGSDGLSRAWTVPITKG